MAIQKIPNTLIADNAITATKIANGTLTADDIAANSITAAKLSASTSPTFGGLTVDGTASNYNTIQFTSGSTGHGTIINLGDTSDANYGSITQFASAAGEGGRMRFIAGATETMNLRGGNVGIGNNNPQHPLHFGEKSQYYISLDRGNSTPGGNLPWLGVFNNNTIANATYGWGFYDSSADGSFQIWNRNGNTTGYNAFTIKRGGNVGIGTDSPDSMLHLSAGSTGVSGGGGAAITMTNKFDNPDNSWIIAPVRTGVSNTGLEIRDVTDSRTDMVFDGLGNVGIGASSVSDKLEVVTAGSSSTENALRLTNPFGFSGLGNGVALIFAQDRSDAEDFPMAKIQSYQSSANSSNEGDLDIYTRNGGSLGVRASFLSGGGIAFNGDRSQSNALDDYEEGSWAPTVSSADGNLTLTSYQEQSGRYTKIGRLVFFNFQMGFVVNDNGTGTIRIGGLPFTQANDAGARTDASVSAYNYDYSSTTKRIAVEGVSNQTYFNFINTRDNTVWEGLDTSTLVDGQTYYFKAAGFYTS